MPEEPQIKKPKRPITDEQRRKLYEGQVRAGELAREKLGHLATPSAAEGPPAAPKGTFTPAPKPPESPPPTPPASRARQQPAAGGQAASTPPPPPGAPRKSLFARLQDRRKR